MGKEPGNGKEHCPGTSHPAAGLWTRCKEPAAHGGLSMAAGKHWKMTALFMIVIYFLMSKYLHFFLFCCKQFSGQRETLPPA